MSQKNKDDIFGLSTVDRRQKIKDMFAKLPREKKDEVETMQLALPTINVSQILALKHGDSPEQDLLYNKETKDLSFVNVADTKEILKDQNKIVRIGTVGGVDLNTIDGLKIHKAQGKPDKYEIDDGLDRFDRVKLTLDGYKIKRSFVDASIVDFEGLTVWLQTRADREIWFESMTDIMIRELSA